MHSMKKSLLALALVVGGAHAATTVTKTYQSYSNEVSDIKVFQAATPVIWIGTYHGVVCINGKDTTWFHPSNSKLPAERISAQNPGNETYKTTVTALDSSGNYWIGYAKKLVRITPAGEITVIDSTGGTPWNNIRGLTAGPGKVYVGNADGSIYQTKSPTAGVPAWNTVPAMTLGASMQLNCLAWGNDTLWQGVTGDKNGNLRYTAADKVTQYYFDKNSNGIAVSAGVYGVWPVTGSNVKFFKTTTVGGYSIFDRDTLYAITPGNSLTKLDGSDSAGMLTVIPLKDYYPVYAKGKRIWAINVGYLGYPSTSLMMDTAPQINAGAMLAGDSLLLLGNVSTTSKLFNFNLNQNVLAANGPYEPSLAGSYVNGAVKVVGMASGSNRAVWIATDSAVYYRDDNATWLAKIYTSNSGVIRTISLDSTQVLWIGKSGGGIVRWKLGATTSPSNAVTDSVIAMTHSGAYSLVLSRSATVAGKPYTLWVNDIKGNTWTKQALTGIGTDSTTIVKMRILDDRTIWVLANGNVYTWTGIAWAKWQGFNPGAIGALSYQNFDIGQYNVWTIAKNASMQSSVWGQAGMSLATNNIVSGAPASYYFAAEGDTSAWFSFASTYGGSGTGTPDNSYVTHVNVKTPAAPDTFVAAHHSYVASYVLLDGKDGIWKVSSEGLEHIQFNQVVTVGIASQSSSSVRQFASIRSGKLALSLPQAASVRVQVTGLDGRTLEDRELGSLTAGEHVVSLGKANGLRLVRVQVGDHVQTLRLTSL
jgi:hypothetical protein